jgi:hypothetical protein
VGRRLLSILRKFCQNHIVFGKDFCKTLLFCHFFAKTGVVLAKFQQWITRGRAGVLPE